MVCNQVFVLVKIKRDLDLTDMNGSLKEISLSLRDAYMDIGGRTKSGTRVERARVRGIKLLKNRTICLLFPLILSYSRGEKEPSFELVGQQCIYIYRQRDLAT
jgi:hypothetical protein